MATTRKYLAVAERVTVALEALSQQLFREVLSVVEEKLTIALQEILEQPIQLRAKVDWLRRAAAVDFWIERNGNREDIMKGQGGSVANILSVGLRMFALATLDEDSHRRFLVLDEQDCWLRPDLVPRLVKIIHDAGRALGVPDPDDLPPRRRDFPAVRGSNLPPGTAWGSWDRGRVGPRQTRWG